MKTWGVGETDVIEVTRVALLAELLRLEAALGRPPTPADVDRYGKFAAEEYRRRFPDWSVALGEAGLVAQERSEPLG